MLNNDALAREQGAARRAGRNVILPANDNTLGGVRQVGLPPVDRPLGAGDPMGFGQLVRDAETIGHMRRIAGGALDLVGLGARISPWGRVLNALDLALFVVDVLDHTQPVGAPAPAYDDPGLGSYLQSRGWVVSNWAPPFAATYDTIVEIREDCAASISNHGNKNAAGGVVVSNDLNAIGEGHVAYQLTSGPRTDLDTFPDGRGYANFGTAHRVSGALPAGGLTQSPGMWPMANPNVVRGLASEPIITYRTISEPEYKAWSSARELTRPGRRDPPGRRIREKKTLSRSAAFMKAVFGALDSVSENAEIVDVFYEALPKKLRRDYEKSLGFRWMHLRSGKWVWIKPKHLRRGLLDSAGQYGIDGADWKARALWKHWDQVDTEAAFKGLINNQTQDFIYGGVYKRLPGNVGKRAGHAFDPGMQGVNKFLQDFIYR